MPGFAVYCINDPNFGLPKPTQIVPLPQNVDDVDPVADDVPDIDLGNLDFFWKIEDWENVWNSIEKGTAVFES